MSFDENENISERLRCESTYEIDDNVGFDEAVKVFVRIRPLNKREISEKQTIGWDYNDTSMLEDTQNGQRVYAYDHCFGPNATNLETYDIVGKPVVLKAMEGYNGTVFTYGQTGSGKTWTMRGCESDPGMMVLCIRDILDWQKRHPKFKYTLRVSYLEVYNEEINDLLGEPGNSTSKNLKIVSEDAIRGAVIGNLVEEIAHTSQDFMEILQRGESSRAYASTEMNNESSRSHTIYRVSIESNEIIRDDTTSSTSLGPGKISYLNLVDLAGSERQKSTKSEGKTLKEGANINKSLLALGAVINKLGESSNKKSLKGTKPAFIPYRDSKLTRILKQSLGGNTLTSVLCAVTPAPMHREETVSTLKFGQLCKSIKNNVKSNDGVLDDKALLRQYRLQISELKALLEGTGGRGDPLSRILHEKSELENRVKVLESMVLQSGGSLSNINQTIISGGEATFKLQETIAEQQSLIAILQRTLDDHHDLEESKAAFEEYEHHSRSELEEDIAKHDEEKVILQNERYKLLKDRSNIEEKEVRIGVLITNIDEKESKLRQLMGTMKEQQEQWQRSITDLSRREDLVEDWQKNHQEREKRLLEAGQVQDKKFSELNKRQSDLSLEESRLLILKNELQEREQRLQIALNRVNSSEQSLATLEEKLNSTELNLKKRETDSDVRDRELLSRRKELESWDLLLREKDRKVSTEQRELDEREIQIKNIEDKIKQKDLESDRKTIELKQSSHLLNENIEKYNKLLIDVELRDKETIELTKKSIIFQEELYQKENNLNNFEKKLLKLQEQMKNIDKKNFELNQRIIEHQKVEDDFYNIKVAQITSRHSNELTQLENLVQQQLKIVSNFQKDLELCQKDIQQKNLQIQEYEQMMEEKNRFIDELREQILYQQGNNNDNHSVTSMNSINTVGGDTNNDVGIMNQQLSALSLTSLSPQPKSILNKLTNNKDELIPGHIDTNDDDSISRRDPMNKLNQNNINNNSNNNNLSRNTSSQEFMLQLAVTQRMLYQILDKHNAVPDLGAKLQPSRNQHLPYNNLNGSPYRRQYMTSQQQQQSIAMSDNNMNSNVMIDKNEQQITISPTHENESIVSSSSSQKQQQKDNFHNHNNNNHNNNNNNNNNNINAAILEEKDYNEDGTNQASPSVGLSRNNPGMRVAPPPPISNTTSTIGGKNISNNGKQSEPVFVRNHGTHITAYTSPPVTNAGTFSTSRRDVGVNAISSYKSSPSPYLTQSFSPNKYQLPNQNNNTVENLPLPQLKSSLSSPPSNHSGIIITKDKRNGIPITSIDLTLASGIKRISPNKGK